MTKLVPLIIVVDDDYDFLEFNRLVLERAGYRVVTAVEPRQAREKMAEEKPDLVISDLMMTSLDSGFSLARSVKEDERYSGVPVIICTSVSTALGLDFEPRSDADMAQMNIDAYFHKPLDPCRLLAKIEELLAEKKRGPTAEKPSPTAEKPSPASKKDRDPS